MDRTPDHGARLRLLLVLLALASGTMSDTRVALRPLAAVGQHEDLGPSGKTPQAARALLASRDAHDRRMAPNTTPRPSTRPVAAQAVQQPSKERVQAAIRAAAAEFEVSEEQLLAVAFCESSFRVDALGKASERGIFQWLPQTWAFYAHRLGYDEEDAWDMTAQTRLTALAFSEGLERWWTCAHAGG